MTELLDLSIDDVLTTTRNVRKRLDFVKPVPRSVVEECIEIALQAPNGSNNQGWEWVAVDDPAKRNRLAELQKEGLKAFLDDAGTPHPSVGTRVDVGRNDRMEAIGESVTYLIEHMHEVPILLVPAMLTPGRLENRNTIYQASNWGSIHQAVWSFMLALRARGLGSAWTTLLMWRERETAELLGIPYEDYTIAGLFPVAYTIGTEFKRAQRRPVSQVLHWNEMTPHS
ncbi:MAG TPA: nitroreductase family protein [Acidimicrobiales bacterium]|nr:nitroreductase family protein [Acidimicrobiales bacterium]